jgi:hypothetical protein
LISSSLSWKTQRKPSSIASYSRKLRVKSSHSRRRPLTDFNKLGLLRRNTRRSGWITCNFRGKMRRIEERSKD